MHSIKHVPSDIVKWGNTENTSCEGPETNHKFWVKTQGGKTNQGQTANKTMMNHTLRKEASALLCEAIQGNFKRLEKHILTYICICKCVFAYNAYIYIYIYCDTYFLSSSENRRRRPRIRIWCLGIRRCSIRPICTVEGRSMVSNTARRGNRWEWLLWNQVSDLGTSSSTISHNTSAVWRGGTQPRLWCVSLGDDCAW